MVVNNEIILSGRCIGQAEYSHSVKGERFFKMPMQVKRLSERTDTLNLTVSEEMSRKLRVGGCYTVKGQLRSYNRSVNEKTCLILTVFVKEAVPCHPLQSANEIRLNGFLCKNPVYRITPFKKQITDMLVAVNRGFNKSDYIPCIAWGSNAFFCSGLKVGANVVIKGRLQSREYEKLLESGEKVIKTAYEVSAFSIEVK